MRRDILDDQEPAPIPKPTPPIDWSETVERRITRPTFPAEPLTVLHISYRDVRKLISDYFGVGAGSSALVAAEYDEHPYMLVAVSTNIEIDEVTHLEQFSQNIALASWDTVRICLCYLAWNGHIAPGEYLIDNA